MIRWSLCFAATLGVCLSAALSASPTTAAEKGKWERSSKSLSSNGSNSSSSNGFSSPSLGKKLSTTPRQLNLGGGSSNSPNWKKLQGLNGSGNTSGGTDSLGSKGFTLGKQKSGRLTLKQPIDLSGLANGGQNGGNVLNGPGQGNFGRTRPNLPAFDPNKISDAIKNGNFQPMQPIGGLGGLAGGGSGNGSPSNPRLPGNLGQIGGGLAEDIRDGIAIDPEVFNPPGNGGNGGNGGDAADPGQGGNGEADPNPGGGNGNDPGGNDPDDNGNPGGGANGGPNGPHDDDCHEHPFPWWPPIIIGGGGGHHHCPPPANITIIEQPITVLPAPEVQNVPATIDLLLMDVRLVDAGDASRNLGPRYRLTFGNAGTLPAGNFRVLAMASRDGVPSEALPTGFAEVAALDAGMVATADVRLPLTADLSTMGALIVAIDSAVQIVETDEQNNVAVLDRTAIVAVDLAAAP